MKRVPNIKGMGLLVSDKIFKGFLYISLCKTSALKRGHFWSLGKNLNSLGRGPLGEAMYQI